jgi:hypothetical protein
LKSLIGAGLLVLVGIVLVLWNDSRFNVATYDCDGAREITLSPNFPGNVNWAEIYLGGWVDEGGVTVIGFPSATPPGANLIYTRDRDVTASYVGELYGPANLSLKPDSQSQCHLRFVYRLKSTLSRLNPLW